MADEIPANIRRLHPEITAEAYQTLRALRQHPDGPRWNFEVGDKVTAEDLQAVQAFRARQDVPDRFAAEPSDEILTWLQSTRPRSWLLQELLPDAPTSELRARWSELPTMGREDLARRLPEVIPFDADLDRLIAYDTSGTTGYAIDVPTHPRTLALAHVLCEVALGAYGIDAEFTAGETACINVCAQENTYVFNNVFSVWNQATFAKVNLREDQWPDGVDSARRFFADLNPRFITSDPVAIAEMIRWELPIEPAAIFSTAVALSPGLRDLASEHFRCPVVDWYSVTETGPIAFAAPDGRGYRPITSDLFVEVIDPDGRPVPDGHWGELAVTGGRNPYVPLLRYRTGDRARHQDGRILDLDGRQAVAFRATDGTPVNPVDIARVLRAHCAFVQHEFVQHRDGRCTLTIRPAPGLPVDTDLMAGLLRDLFGDDQPLEVRVDPDLGSTSKVLPYRSELKP